MANPFLRAVNDRPRRQAFTGASTSRLYQDWNVGAYSADSEARGVRALLRWRARQLVNDNAYATGFITEVKNNVIGPKGIRLRARVKTAAKELHKRSNNLLEDAWKDFCLPENASADTHDSFIDIENMVIATIATDGECFIRKRKYYDNDHGYALSFIDADQVDDWYNVLPSPNQNEIRSGVEIDENGRPVAYHIWTRHLSDSGQRIRQRVGASEILHLFVRYRANQTRGITWFAPILTSLKMYDGLTESELVASRASAAKMGFIVTKNPELGSFTGINPDEDAAVQRLMEASPGAIEELAPGQEIQAFDPQHPNGIFKDFTEVILRGIARGLGISYLGLTGDLTGANYSSMRAGMLPERDHWRSIQTWLATQFHRRVFAEWVDMASLTGALKGDARIGADYKDVQWKPRGWRSVDPLKDVQADVLSIQHGMGSRTQSMDDEGEEIEEVFQNLSDEQDLADEYGIDITPQATPVANRPMGTPSQTDNETGNTDPNNPNNNDQNAEDDRLQRWAAERIAANDLALSVKRGTPKSNGHHKVER